jgi:nitrite reductase/ring-hydroxylating ferredoxin subunit
LSAKSLVNRYLTIPKKNFQELTSRSFQIKIHGYLFQGFVIRKQNKFYAYQNLCRHLPVTLDLKDNAFFNHDKKYLQCHMHGATYEIETGHCIAGPCIGANLNALELKEEENQLVITIPDPDATKP